LALRACEDSILHTGGREQTVRVDLHRNDAVSCAKKIAMLLASREATIARPPRACSSVPVASGSKPCGAPLISETIRPFASSTAIFLSAAPPASDNAAEVSALDSAEANAAPVAR